jgi:hypothetical protein
LASKLVCFATNGMIILEGLKTGVIVQLINKHATFVNEMNCIAHSYNLVAQTFSKLSLVAKIEVLLQSMYVYFTHSPKRHMELTKLVEILETKGGKIFCNVKT